MARDRRETLLGIIHCAATRPSADIDILDVNQWHIRRGIWSPRGPSGYHGLIRRDGTLQLGRDAMEMGAHAIGHNDVSVSVCLAGGVSEEDITVPENNFTPAQWETLKEVLHYWWAIWPDLVVCGHRELGVPKACPSFDVQEWLEGKFNSQPSNREALAEYLRAYRERRK